ncbi:RTA1 like protein-domain-containing protein [Apiospora kogelbergensis]|uniref:RTA1 like protein-domain-containing protein n=1 Tax=Apiospora kogelbergensis TaxID=1337665 RepID=UPI003131DECD
MSDGKKVGGSLYYYAPNAGAADFFMAAFIVTMAFHLVQCWRFKCFKVTALYPFCGALFTAGFACRLYETRHYDNIPVYIASQCLIYFAPPLVELANYHILGRLLYYVPYCTPIHPGRVLTTFGALSAVVEILNALGISYIANPNARANIHQLGEILTKVSLFLQIVVISLFIVLASTFYNRCRRAGVANHNVSMVLLTLYISSGLILVRTIYRLVEHFSTSRSQLTDPNVDWSAVSPILRHEWFFYVFEAAVMLVNIFLWNALHPRRYLPESYQMYLAQDGKAELAGPGWESGQNLWITLIDPFGMMQCALDRENDKKDGKQRPFWENNGYHRSKATV